MNKNYFNILKNQQMKLIPKAISMMVLSMILVGCLAEKSSNTKDIFVVPTIINSQFGDSILTSKYRAAHISEVFPRFAGKYKFQENIDINPNKQDTTIYNDFIGGYSRINSNDSLDATGFELVVDYKTTVKYNRFSDSLAYEHYPVYFVNSTNSDKIFLAKDSYVFGIQEALDQQKWARWRPIEGRGFDFCGNGKWGLIVHPNEFIVVLMRKYEGDLETEIKVRFALGDNIYVSKPFIGFINEKQFTIRDSSYLQRRLQETNGKAAVGLFYGAVPREEEWAVKTFNFSR